MPFPPTFTNVWDITQPPDTELANLLGQNLRDLKDSVMQRMSLLSGTFSNRPTPEIVNATWGGAGYGLTYISTDTNQLFQWNGGAWVDITASIGGGNVTLNTQPNVPAYAGNGLLQNMYTYVIPANSVPFMHGFRVRAAWSTVHGGTNSVFQLAIDGQVVQNDNTATSGIFTSEHTILNTGATAATKNGFIQDNGTMIWTAGTMSFLNWVNNQSLQLSFTGNALSTVTLFQWIVESL